MPLPSLHHRRPAAALLLVLVMLALMAFIVTQIIASAEQQITWEAQRSEDDVLRRNAFSGLEVTLSVLGAFRQIDGTLYGPAQGWGDPLALAGFSGSDGVEVSVTITDESGYYGISSMDVFTLRRYFEDLGFGADHAQILTNCLLDWTDPDSNERINGAEEGSYPYGIAPPNRPLKSLSELKLIKGFEEAFFNGDGTGNDAWQKLVGSVSLLGTSARPNINTAPREVLEILSLRYGIDPETVLSMRDGGGNLSGSGTVYRNAGDLGRASLPVEMGNYVSFNCTRIRIVSRATKGDVSMIVDTLLDTSNTSAARNNQFPFAITQQRVNALLQQ
ncbi:MAG: general secretion pathway protein GspK [Puniceicoccales bacterium]|jgi:type II secretory pathway component PulK|nr:general secretion pathway protein GspK [Puniceicoccales bacterium]